MPGSGPSRLMGRLRLALAGLRTLHYLPELLHDLRTRRELEVAHALGLKLVRFKSRTKWLWWTPAYSAVTRVLQCVPAGAPSADGSTSTPTCSRIRPGTDLRRAMHSATERDDVNGGSQHLPRRTLLSQRAR